MENSLVQLALVGQPDCLWRCIVRETGQAFDIAAPVFEIDDTARIGVTALAPAGAPILLAGGVTEQRYSGAFVEDPDLSLEMVLRLADDSPVVRFRYVLRSRRPG